MINFSYDKDILLKGKAEMDDITILMHLNYRDLVRKYGLAIMQGYNNMLGDLSRELTFDGLVFARTSAIDRNATKN